MHGPGRTQILVGTSIQRERTELWAFAWQLAGASGVVLVVGLAGGWVVSARILKPLAAISATASAISETNLSERIDAAKVDQELSELAGVLNSTFARLESAFERQTRFTADASHELRTPLAIIRSHAELALARPRTDDEYREALGSCLRSAKRMARLVDALLILARADAGKLVKALESLDLRGVVIETANLLQPLAQAKGVCVHIETAPAYVVGDADRLAQVVTNLMTNAIDYNRPGGEVRVRLRTESAWAVLSVEDTGQGIPEEDCAHIFERFYRVDKARSRASGGHGLGLAICKSIVEAHGGKIDFESRPAHGSIFRVHLPCSAALWEAPE